jgi:hypothetical protein
MKYVEKIIDIQTNDVTEKPYSAELIAEAEASQAEAAIQTAELLATEAAKAEAEAKLEALGLTKEDLRALGL